MTSITQQWRAFAERLWAAKEKRQLIFSTHNPNLVVIGDAELILHCDYRQDQQATGICIAHAGGLDERELRAVVGDVMEGGENAFRLRMDRYGF